MIITEIQRDKEPSNRPIRVAAYCRVSTNSDDQLHSFAAQLNYYRDYCKSHPNCVLVDIYADKGITGTSMEKRDQFMRMIKDCEHGKIDRIVTKSVTRFGRNNEETLAITRKLKSMDVSVFFEQDNLDTGMMSSEFLMSLLGMRAQSESMNISQNMRWSYKKRMQSGEFNTCRPPLGYSLVNGELVIVEEEAQLVREIFDMYLSGIGQTSIANILNQRNATKRYGYKKWHTYSIHYILNNERYKGDARLQKRYTTVTLPFREKINHGEEDQYYVENSNPPIVAREVFDAVQVLLAERNRAAEKGTGIKSVLSGYMKCPQCGKAMKRTCKNGVTAWVCKGYANKTSECTAHRIDEKELKRLFMKMVGKLSDNRKYIITDTIEQIRRVLEISGSNRSRIGEIDTEIANLTERKSQITRLHTKGILNDADYSGKIADISSNMTKLRSERNRFINLDKNEACLNDLIALDEELANCSDTLFFNEVLFRNIIERIEVFEDDVVCFHLLGGLIFKERRQRNA